jgi:hypothetical protein
MPRAIAHSNDIEACGLSLTELQELWLGPNPGGSCFESREELVAAWAQGRDTVMRLWGSHGRRPCGWWAFETDLKHPGYFNEQSTLWRAGVLSEEERAELEHRWRREYDAARGKSAQERREAYAHHDIPPELIKAWAPSRRRRSAASAAVPEQSAPGVAEGEDHSAKELRSDTIPAARRLE